jgi:hypothetical protein
MQRASVVFPHPLDPAIKSISPWARENEIFCIAGSGRERYWNDKFSMTKGESGILISCMMKSAHYGA